MEIKYAFICRDANRSGHLINALAISVDDRVAVPTLPVNLRFHLVIVFRAAKSEVGEHSLRLQFLDNENVSDLVQPVNVSDHSGEGHSYVTVIVDVEVPINEADWHRIRVLVDGKELRRFRFEAVLQQA